MNINKIVNIYIIKIISFSCGENFTMVIASDPEEKLENEIKKEFMNEALSTIRNRMQIYREFRNFCVKSKSKSKNKKGSNGIEIQLENFTENTNTKIIDYYNMSKVTENTNPENERYIFQNSYPNETKTEVLRTLSTEETNEHFEQHNKIRKYQNELNRIFRNPSMQKSNFIKEIDTLNLDQSTKIEKKSKTTFCFHKKKKSEIQTRIMDQSNSNNFLGSLVDSKSANLDTHIINSKLVNEKLPEKEIKNCSSPKLSLRLNLEAITNGHMRSGTIKIFNLLIY